MYEISQHLDCDPSETKARLRSLTAIARMLLGPKNMIVQLAREAEDSGQYAELNALVRALPSIPYRRLLATWAETFR